MPNRLTEECAAMAANMLDGELAAIGRKMPDRDATPLQKAVRQEIQKRGLRK